MFKYRGIRIGLITFTFGLASVWSSGAVEYGIWEVPVDLPVASDSIIIVQPFTKSEIPRAGGHNFSDVHTFFNSEAGKAYLLRRKNSN
jgi:hypothetical protein